MIACLIIIGLLIFFLVNILNSNQRTDGHNSLYNNGDTTVTTTNTENICLSQQCVHSASSILEKVDIQVNPCDDFYNFACGNFINLTNIPEDKSSVNMFSVIEDTLANQLNGLLSADIDETEIKPFVLTKFMYQNCIAVSEIEKTSMATIKKIIQKLGGWPVLNDTDWNQNQTWLEIVHNSANMGYTSSFLMTFSIASDYDNSTRRILDVSEILFLLKIGLTFIILIFT